MLAETILLPRQATRLLSASLVVGFVAIMAISLITVVGLLWGVSVCLMFFLAHTSSTQLFIMIVIASGAYQLGQAIKRKRGAL